MVADRVLIVITDGELHDAAAVQARLRDTAVYDGRVFVAAVGDDTNRVAMQGVAAAGFGKAWCLGAEAAGPPRCVPKIPTMLRELLAAAQQRNNDAILAAKRADEGTATATRDLQWQRDGDDAARPVTARLLPTEEPWRTTYRGRRGRSELDTMLRGGTVHPDTVDAAGKTPLMHSAYTGRSAASRVLLEHGASARVGDAANGRTPLHFAAWNGDLATCKLLVGQGGAGVDATDNYGLTPLFLAAQEKKHDVCAYLVERGAANPRKVAQLYAEQAASAR